jgi:hypothetical protein
MKDSESNSSKSLNGYNLEEKVESLLNQMLQTKHIVSFTKQPVYNDQFRPDFEIHTTKRIIVVDTTTTIRSDRMHGKQWTAYGTKSHSNLQDVYFLVICEARDCIGTLANRKKELDHASKERQKIKGEGVHSKFVTYIDDLLHFDEFTTFLKSLK